MKITNHTIIIFSASDPEVSPKMQDATPTRKKSPASRLKTTDETLIRKIPAHSNSFNNSISGRTANFANHFRNVISFYSFRYVNGLKAFTALEGAFIEQGYA